MPSDQRADSHEKPLEKEDKGRITLYISKSVLKRFKHRAVDEDKDLSQLAEETFIAFLNDAAQGSE